MQNYLFITFKKNGYLHFFVNFFIIFFSILNVNAQEKEVKDGFTKYTYSSGKVSSEGFIKNGKPDGYWKTYYENGIIKYFSENNRRLWVFKQLEKLKLLDAIEVRLEKTNNKKYIKNTYALEAKIKKRH